jgi:dolichyl-phosphate beta-glucosyltransferase
LVTPYLSLILPAFNEAGSIRQTLEQTRQYLDQQDWPYEIIVSADGTDGTREAARAAAGRDRRVRVLGELTRGGKGRGIRQAVALAEGELIGFSDADYKTPIEELAKVLPWFERGFDIVIGSRAVKDAIIECPAPWYRQAGSRFFALGMRLVVGLHHIRDTQCGFKFFRRAVARDLFSRQVIDGYMFDVEILHLASRAGYPLKEVGVRWRGDADSRLELVRGNWRNLKDLLRIRLGTLSARASQRGGQGHLPEEGPDLRSRAA